MKLAQLRNRITRARVAAAAVLVAAVPGALLVVGVVVVAVGVSTIYRPAGVIVLGLALAVFGWGLMPEDGGQS